MYNQPFFIPTYRTIPNIMRIRAIPTRGFTFKRTSSFGRLGNIFKGIKTFNWTSLINNTSKTLGIINQSIPLVKQAGPVFGNMKSMIKLASVFKDETDNIPRTTPNNNTYTKTITKEKESSNDNYNGSDSPTFFIN